MKYKLNNIEVSKEQVRELLKANPELLEDKTFPQEGDEYWFLTGDGQTGSITWVDDKRDKDRQALDNLFQTEKQTIHARDFDKATVAIWNWQRRECPFVPDWKDNEQENWSLNYDHDDEEWDCDWSFSFQENFHLPYFVIKEDAERCIKECAEHLEVIKKGRYE